MAKLREECPWNKAQTFDTLRPMTVEEVYELSDAILKKSDKDTVKELGDVLFHVVFYSRIAEEEGKYDLGDVLEKLCEKMIFRHPHVFSDTSAVDAKEVSENWEMIKAREKGGNKRILSGIPDAMPTVLKAYSMQDKARGVGFDWEDRAQVWDKVEEEKGELMAEIAAMEAATGVTGKSESEVAGESAGAASSDAFEAARERAEAELGDYMFAIINAARLYGINPDTALNRSCEKFRRRFTYLEENTIRKGIDLHALSLRQMDEIWEEAKSKGL